jgi:hypothetical protein
MDPLTNIRNAAHNAIAVLGWLAFLQWIVVAAIDYSGIHLSMTLSADLGRAGLVIVGISKAIDSANNALSKFASSRSGPGVIPDAPPVPSAPPAAVPAIAAPPAPPQPF